LDVKRRGLVVDGIVAGDVGMGRVVDAGDVGKGRVVVVGKIPAVFYAVHEEQNWVCVDIVDQSCG
jgi:hypothetical protein